MTHSRFPLTFPDNFLWGTASAAHHVEGNNTNNQWWDFEQEPGAIWYGDKSGLACNWWTDAEQDFGRMAEMGLNTHRLSVEWSRIEPEPGVFDHAALDRYREMLDGLHSRGMTPMVTLHHFTDPRWLTRIGGWENGAVVSLFRRFAEKTVAALGDLCDFWCTINEPMIYTTFGWVVGRFPPRKRNVVRAFQVVQHMLSAHAEAYHAIHRLQPDSRVGYAKHVRLFTPYHPDSRWDRYAAGLRRWLFEHIWVAATRDGWLRPPLLPGRDRRLVDSYDYIGINYYSRDHTRFTPNPRKLFGEDFYEEEAELSDAGREGVFSQYHPEGLRQVCREVDRFHPGVPIYITENGVPDRHDRFRARWLVAHLAELHAAIDEGCNVKGYYHWTFVDNFEWAEGWGLRFGLYALDPKTLVRTARPSAEIYARIAHENGIGEELVRHYAPEYLADEGERRRPSPAPARP